ncbi:MAG: SRPBCC domain-containing protein [Gammaproteobacteria bacterium]|nr:SRPBCC domain-containing protein [Gammaproteobacteria bacterium]MDH3578116.1 SRPBCC domain-containing protein [Gammaproteobacteria bacterium]
MNIENVSAKARIRIHESPSEVFAAFADARKMSKFWFTRRDHGLKEGKSIKWFLGSREDALSFDVFVKELSEPYRLVIEWVGHDGNPTQVSWSFEETEERDTILTIEESGYAGTREAIIERVLDSTGGFNQVIIAAKALVEHGAELNVVADHA